MSLAEGDTIQCSVRYESGRCTNAAVGGLPLCGPCLTVLLSEAEPGRRRSLAGLPHLPGEVVDRLVDDPDPGVRARLAMREDLPDATARRFADPRREPSPTVWRSFAATRTGAAHAAALLATGDRVTMLVLATNPATPPDILDRLVGLPDTEIVATVTATRAGQSPDSSVISQVLGARAVPTRPIAEGPPGTPWPGVPSSKQATGDIIETVVPVTSDDPGAHRSLVVGFFIVAAIVVALVVVLARGGSGDDVTRSAPGNDPVAATPSTSPNTPATTSEGSPSTTRSPDTASGSGTEAVMLDLTMTAQSGRFCDVAEITISFNGPTAYVTVTDDADRELWTGPWRSGATKSIDLVAPSRHLDARLTTTADPDDLRPSGSVQGTFC